MPVVTCPACRAEQIAPSVMEGLTVPCERCRADVPVGSVKPRAKRAKPAAEPVYMDPGPVLY